MTDGERQAMKEIMCHNNEFDLLLEELLAYYDEGVELTLKGQPASPKRIVHECVIRERGRYMSDFIPDGEGQLKEIRFDIIKST